jgi:hypothetical protein
MATNSDYNPSAMQGKEVGVAGKVKLNPAAVAAVAAVAVIFLMIGVLLGTRLVVGQHHNPYLSL